MSKNELTIKVPGKLMVAGEFSVLVPHQHLAVTAVDRFVYSTIAPAEAGELTLTDFNLHKLHWNYDAGNLSIESEDERLSFVKAAMEVTCAYLEEQRKAIEPFSLSIRSELDDASGIKYGLGSSAAVVTAVVSAIMAYFNKKEMNKDIIFKLAAIAHVKIQGSGSGADVAASVYGGILEYASFQAEWLIEAYHQSASISELVAKDWIYLSIKPIKLPETVYFRVGWTGKPASTVKLVDKILQQKEQNPSVFQDFLQKSEEAVQILFRGIEQEDLSSILKGIKANRSTLAEIGRRANTPIETPLLTTLCELTEKHGGAGKPSGAGGGDCGIAFMPSKQQADELMIDWEKAGIKPLPLTSYATGVTID